MITVLSGANAYLRTKKLKQLKDEFAKEYGAQNIEKVSGESLESANLPSLIQGGSLFSTNRMVVIYDLSQNKETAENFLQYLDKTPDEVEVVLVEASPDKRTSFYKALKKVKDFFEFEQPREADLIGWIYSYAKEIGGEVGRLEATQLLESVGLDQERLVNEIDKLIAYDPKVSKQNIELLVEKRPQNTVFQLLDKVLSGDKQRASELLKSLENAFEDPYQITNLLIWQVQALAVVKSAGSRPDSEVAKDTKLNPYVVTKTKRLARSIDQAKLRDIIAKCAELDIDIKMSKNQPWRVLEQAIISM